MHLFARAVINGFGFALGALLLRKVAKQLNIDDPAAPLPPRTGEAVAPGDAPQSA